MDKLTKLKISCMFLCLENIDNNYGVDSKYLTKIKSLADTISKTEAYTHPLSNEEVVEFCIQQIEECLK